MKFDPDLARELMLKVEAIPAGEMRVNDYFLIEGKPPKEISRHLEILIQEGFIEGSTIVAADGLVAEVRASDLTYRGHQFLEAARSDTAWKKVKGLLREKGVSMTMSIIQATLVKIAEASIAG